MADSDEPREWGRIILSFLGTLIAIPMLFVAACMPATAAIAWLHDLILELGGHTSERTATTLFFGFLAVYAAAFLGFGIRWAIRTENSGVRWGVLTSLAGLLALAAFVLAENWSTLF